MIRPLLRNITFFDDPKRRGILVSGIVLVCVVGLLLWKPRANLPRPGESATAVLPVVPRISTEGGYVGSSACQACHADQHASWHRSYHRTMTQRANAETVRAPFQNEQLDFQGISYRLHRDEGRFFVSIDEPADSSIPAASAERREIVMTTGSHHIQVYWVFDPPSQMLIELPFYFHLESGRWLLRDDTMLHPPDQPQTPSIWNDRCIKCHSVNGVPGRSPGATVYATRVAELGIACEACHGPGLQHVTQAERASAGDSTAAAAIVNPRKLDSHAATQVCGRCHSASQPVDNGEFLQRGIPFRPGKNLHDYVTLNEYSPDHPRPVLPGAETTFVEDYSIDGFWGDGTCRVGGDEYNAFIESPCYQHGEISCLSCHSLHQSEPDDQLAADARGNGACTQCHGETRFAEQLSGHTHHAPGSPGSQCYNCHMPHTSYALLTAMRSHRISKPDVGESVRFGKPNACNLCHLDRSLQWTSGRLADWYGTPEPDFDQDQQQVAASILWLLRGNAATRIIAAWHLGWAPALQSSGSDWEGAFLAPLLDDPYSAVRFVAARSLRTLPGYGEFEFDYVGPPPSREAAATSVMEMWNSTIHLPGEDDRGKAVLLNADGTLRRAEVERLLRQRDNRPVSIAE